MRVLVVDQNPEDACSWYRCSGPWSAMARTGEVDVVFNDNPNWRDMRGFDYIFLTRPHQPVNLIAIRAAKWHGVRVWVDFDDDLFAIPPENHVRMVMGTQSAQSVMRNSVLLADVVTVATEALRVAIVELLPKSDQHRVKVIPNALDKSFAASRKQLPKSKVPMILWRGSSTHVADLQEYRHVILSRSKQTPEALWMFMGFEPWFSGHLKSIIMPPQMLFEYFKTLAGLSVSAGIVPLVKNQFNLCKSDIAVMELSFAGARCLVPSFWPKIPGTVTYDDEESFGYGLQEVIEGHADCTETFEYYLAERGLKKMNGMRFAILACAP